MSATYFGRKAGFTYAGTIHEVADSSEFLDHFLENSIGTCGIGNVEAVSASLVFRCSQLLRLRYDDAVWRRGGFRRLNASQPIDRHRQAENVCFPKRAAAAEAGSKAAPRFVGFFRKSEEDPEEFPALA